MRHFQLKEQMKWHRLVRGIGVGEGKNQEPSPTESKLWKSTWLVPILRVCMFLSTASKAQFCVISKAAESAWQCRALDFQKAFLIFHKAIKYLPYMDGRKRIPSKSWNPKMNSLCTGLNQHVQTTNIVNSYTKRLLSSFPSHTHLMKCLGRSHSFVRKPQRNSEPQLAPPFKS